MNIHVDHGPVSHRVRSLSDADEAIASKSAFVVRKALADSEHKQVSLADMLGLSESAMSRLMNDDLVQVARVMAVLGLKVVPANQVCIDPESYDLSRRLVDAAAKRVSLLDAVSGVA